jgi:putative ABC transport system ATP-binding protein
VIGVEPRLVVETIGLTKIYGDGTKVYALDGVNLQVADSEFAAVMGPSGSGKSTLLNMIGALDEPTSGSVLVNGQDLAEVDDLDRFRAREIGFVFQLHNLIPTLTAAENVAVPMQGVDVPGPERRERSLALLDMVDLGDRADFLPGQLSGGQRQRVAIARALANDPALILADEPTGNLDSTAGTDIVRLFHRLNREQGKTIIIVTHDPVVALSCRRIITLRDGQIGQDELVSRSYLRQLEEIRDTPLGQLLFGDQEIRRVGDGRERGSAAEHPALTHASAPDQP